ncbi:MAG: SRPBCC family protein [Myxococcota bacterium]
MARYVDAIDLPIPIEEAFDYLADFSKTAEWDPGVARARRITRGKVRKGSRFEVTVSFLGRRVPFEYEITEYERPSRLVLTGGDASLRSIDEITFVARPDGTRVTYEAQVELLGIRQLAEPVLQVLFQRVGRLAVRGLRERWANVDARESGPRCVSIAKRASRVKRTTNTKRRPASPGPKRAASSS